MTKPTVSKSVKNIPAKVPMSESASKFRADWTADDCIVELQRIAKIDETQVITRNYFRNHAECSESTWNRFFGTFLEFKRQAKIILSRPQHQLERQIAKHASVDHYRKMNVERADWGGKYLRENSARFKTAIIACDLHDIEIDPFYLRVITDTVKRAKPDLFVYGGDLFDLPEFGKYGVDPREWDVVGRIKFAHDKILGPIRAAAPDAQIDLIEGNHEARMLRLLGDETPALRVVLSDLHDFTISKLLGLDRFNMNYVAKLDLAAYTQRDFKNELRNNYRVYWKSFMVHHFPQGKNMGVPGVNGHHHSHVVTPLFNQTYGAYEWHQSGSGHMRSASYAEGEKWHNGFTIANVDTKTRSTTFDYVVVGEHHAVAGGKWYYREDSERCNAPLTC